MNRYDLFPRSKTAPAWTEKLLAKFGQNKYGENLFRVIWLPSRSYLVGGYFEATQDFTYRRMPKYSVNENKWGLEKWLPATTYGSPEVWEWQTTTQEGFLACGPFPAHGEYELISTFSSSKGNIGYVPLHPGMIEMQARFCWAGREQTVWDIRNAVKSTEDAKIQKQDANFEAMWENIQHSRKGLTFGAAGSYNQEEAFLAYREKLLSLGDQAFHSQSNFTKGFAQQGQ